jgi:calreticulin
MLTLFVTRALLATTLFSETFDDGDAWADRWVVSRATEEDKAGVWVRNQSAWHAAQAGWGLATTQDARFYAISARFDAPVSTRERTLHVLYSVQHPQTIDCGGGYLKLFPSSVEQPTLHGESPYHLMFGPDICGATKRTHLIVAYDGRNVARRASLPCESDVYSHLYGLRLAPDGAYNVTIDGKGVGAGNLRDDFDLLPPKEIPDPQASKPADWVDEATIDDPEDAKPDGWDDVPAQIPDPTATKPEDWDTEDDGEWEAPTIANPDYKGAWTPRRIANPEYKGAWVHPRIPNPEYADDPTLGTFDDIGVLAFEIWQVRAGTIFDSILVTDDDDEAARHVGAFVGAVPAAERAKKAELDVAKEAETAKDAAVETPKETKDEM